MALPPFPERLITLQKDREIHTGICADGRQVMMGPLDSSLIALFFDPAGHLLSYEERKDKQKHQLDSERSEPVIRQWMTELACHEEPIQVRPFSVEEWSIEIIDGLADFEKGWGTEPEDLAENAAMRQALIDGGYYVFWWGKGTTMTPDVEVREQAYQLELRRRDVRQTKFDAIVRAATDEVVREVAGTKPPLFSPRTHLFLGSAGIDPKYLVIQYIFRSDGDLAEAERTGLTKRIIELTLERLRRHGYPVEALDEKKVGFITDEDVQRQTNGDYWLYFK